MQQVVALLTEECGTGRSELVLKHQLASLVNVADGALAMTTYAVLLWSQHKLMGIKNLPFPVYCLLNLLLRSKSLLLMWSSSVQNVIHRVQESP